MWSSDYLLTTLRELAGMGRMPSLRTRQCPRHGSCVMVEPVQRAWLFERFAITVARIDFLDPALVDRADARERGVRVEVRPSQSTPEGSLYASSAELLKPAICRIDLLESRPHAADRMHWHPSMLRGEPGDRTMEAEMGGDPVGWLVVQLMSFDAILLRAGIEDLHAMNADVLAVRAVVEEIAGCVASGLEWARETPWPPAVHDERGLAGLA